MEKLLFMRNIVSEGNMVFSRHSVLNFPFLLFVSFSIYLPFLPVPLSPSFSAPFLLLACLFLILFLFFPLHVISCHLILFLFTCLSFLTLFCLFPFHLTLSVSNSFSVSLTQALSAAFGRTALSCWFWLLLIQLVPSALQPGCAAVSG